MSGPVFQALSFPVCENGKQTFKKYLFIYLAVSGLSCGTRNFIESWGIFCSGAEVQ